MGVDITKYICFKKCSILKKNAEIKSEKYFYHVIVSLEFTGYYWKTFVIFFEFKQHKSCSSESLLY